jgi:hypothetical protein
MQVVRYNENYAEQWNNFVEQSNTPCLLFDRNFINYHKNRFLDHSLLFFEKNKLVALLPANQKENCLFSHEGLTFGGIIIKPFTKYVVKEQIINALLAYCQEQNFDNLFIKQLPTFLQIAPDESDVFLWKSHNSQTTHLDLNCVIDFSQNAMWQDQKYRHIDKAKKANLVISQTQIDVDSYNTCHAYAEFWEILAQNLLTRFGLSPVHNLNEINYLQKKFPVKISLYVAKKEDKIVAGTVLFDYGQAIHAQYIAANKIGKEIGALDFLFSEIIPKLKNKYRFLSFGISNTRKGYEVNQGLLAWKQGFGGVICVHEQLKIIL